MPQSRASRKGDILRGRAGTVYGDSTLGMLVEMLVVKLVEW